MPESISDIEFTEILVRSIVARDALSEHDCKVNPTWCPGYDIGCEEAEILSETDGTAWELASNAIAERFATVTNIKAETSPVIDEVT